MNDSDKYLRPLISVVIPCFNQARFLGEAIASVLAGICQDFEIIVIDDGSVDATSEVARKYPQARYFKQINQGVSSARNTGLQESRGRYLVFLDADDRLLPDALCAGLRCMEEHPDAAFVSGGHCRIDESGHITEQPTPARIDEDHYLAFLRENYVGMHGAVMYQRRSLTECGGFDRSLPACEDYDLYLRLSRTNAVACHETVVAEYRTYGSSMSADAGRMLATVMKILKSQRKYMEGDPRYIHAYRAGMRNWKIYYARQFATQLSSGTAGGDFTTISSGLFTMLRYAPVDFLRFAYHSRVRPALPTAFLRVLARLRGYPYYPPVGRIRFGDLRRLKPISEWYGFERGLPIDRYYIERFLDKHSIEIKGRVLEIGESVYTRRFGEDRVTTSDVLHVEKGNPQATFIGDLTSAEHIPSNAFDCAIITQTLHLIYDVRSALHTLHRILKPGGVLMATVPGISQISKDKWGKSWYWSFTTLSMRRLVEEVFPPEGVIVGAQGSVLSATAFLQGMAARELHKDELDHHDEQYELLITVRAEKPIS